MANESKSDFEVGYTAMQRNLDSALAEHKTTSPTAEQSRQFVQDTAINASRHVAGGWLPPGISAETLDRIEDGKKFESGMRRAIEDWSHTNNHALLEQIGQPAHASSMAQRHEPQQKQRETQDFGFSW